MSSYSYSEAVQILSNFKSAYNTNTTTAIQQKKTLATLEAQLQSAISSNADQATINAAAVAVSNQQAALSTTLAQLGAANVAKFNAQTVVNSANNISNATPRTTPVFGPTGPTGATGSTGAIGATGATGPSSFSSGIQISALSEKVVAASVSGNTITLDYSQGSCFFTNAAFTGNMTIQVSNVPYTTQNSIYSIVLIYPPTSNKYYGSTIKVSTTTSGYTTVSGVFNGASSSVSSVLGSANTYALQQLNIVNSAGTLVYLLTVNGYGA